VKRRSLLQAGALGAATLPGFLARAFAQERCGADAEEVAAVARAYRRARALGRPLLVLVVPKRPWVDADSSEEEWRERAQRGDVLGQWILHGGDDALALFSLVEVLAARLEDLRRIVPSAAEAGARLPHFVIVDVVTAQAAAFHAELPPDPPPPEDRYGSAADEIAYERISDARTEVLTALLRTALLPDDAAVERLVAQESSRPALELRAAELYRRAMRADDDERTRIIARLATAARMRLVDRDPSGAEWRYDHCPLCGMGWVPERSRRFLYFLTRFGD
jgi:hypothetical protein